jgi:hypothetical protein
MIGFCPPGFRRRFSQAESAGDSVSQARVPFPGRLNFTQEAGVTKDGLPAPKGTELPRPHVGRPFPRRKCRKPLVPEGHRDITK